MTHLQQHQRGVEASTPSAFLQGGKGGKSALLNSLAVKKP